MDFSRMSGNYRGPFIEKKMMSGDQRGPVVEYSRMSQVQ